MSGELDISASRDPDGEVSIEVYRDHANMISISISPTGSFSWAGSFTGETSHGNDPRRMGILLFKILNEALEDD